MVELQTKAVEEVIAVFREMQARMSQLIEGLKDIVVSTEKADGERSAAVAAVKKYLRYYRRDRRQCRNRQ